jgi:hypothetical protein
MDVRKTALGMLFLSVSSITTVQAGFLTEMPFVVATVGTLGVVACVLVLVSVSTTARD